MKLTSYKKLIHKKIENNHFKFPLQYLQVLNQYVKWRICFFYLANEVERQTTIMLSQSIRHNSKLQTNRP